MATKMRKTVEVAEIKRKANIALSVVSEGNTPDFRRGVFAMLESILHDTANYKGFQYVMVPDDARTAEGYLIDGKYDDTRRRYY